MVWWYNEWASGMDWDLGGKQVGMKKIWIWRIVYIILSVASVGLFIYCVSSRDLKRLLPSIICVIFTIIVQANSRFLFPLKQRKYTANLQEG